MKVKFIGDPSDDFSGPKVLRMSFSKDGAITAFPKDQFVGATAEIAAELAGNPHFVIEEGDAPAYVPPAYVEEAEAEAPAGEAAPSAGLTKAETLERLQAMADRGLDVQFDGRMGLPKLRGILEAAEFEHGED